MRDLKNITDKKTENKSLLRSISQQKKTSSLRKSLSESPKKRRRLRIILPAVACLLALFPVAFLVFSPKSAISASGIQEKLLPDKVDLWESFYLAYRGLRNARNDGQTLSTRFQDGRTVVYAIDSELQKRVETVFQANKVPYGAFVAIDPKTGRVLSMVGFSSTDRNWGANACSNIYPMASLFKIITAAAALEEKKVSADTVVAFRGGNTSENPKKWVIKSKGNREMDLSLAMGKSVNPVFGRLASDVVGRDAIISMSNRFGFNEVMFPGVGITPSKTMYPRDELELRLMGAGLGREVKTSPLHAAAIIAAVANEGLMMAPGLAAEVIGPDGSSEYVHQPRPLRQVISPEVSSQLSRMLETTVTRGTSRRVFHDRRGRPMLGSLDICAKTGSIDGKDPAGHYSWFAAYAPADDPQIALVALVINGPRWKIKAANVGEQALEAFFK